MAETIESFVAKIRTEGVEQGKQEAEQLRNKAQKDAEQIINEARGLAEKIIADANVEAAGIMARSRTELELAARDATLKLRESLERAAKAVLAGQVETQLGDAEFLKELIQAVVTRYIEADIHGSAIISISPEMRKQLVDWAMNELRKSAGGTGMVIDLKDGLRQAGFEFSFQGATIEITRDSVVETLMQLVSPGLREVLKQANQAGGEA